MEKNTNYKGHERNYRCNLFGVHLPFFKIFENAAGFTAFYSTGALITQTLASYVSSQIPTLEKQFGLSSYESGIIMTFNDIGFITCMVLVSSIPRLVHIPRWLFGTMLLFGISGILCSLPHFLFSSRSSIHVLSNSMEPNMSVSIATGNAESDFFLCSNLTEANRNTSNESMELLRKKQSGQLDHSVKTVSIAIIGIGMVLQGVAKSPRGPFTTVYLDDGCDKTKTGFYLGIIIGCSIFGPALSFGLGGLFSRIYITLEDVDMSPRDPRWLGAWWLGFVVFGVLTFIFALPMLCFPRYLADKKSKNYIDKEKLNTETTTDQSTKLSRFERFKERATSYLRVVRSPVYTCTLVATVMSFSAIVGKIIFLSKYIAAQFGIPLWQANITVSAANLITVSVGSILGGTITRKVPMSPRRCYQVVVCLFLIQYATTCIEIFFGCDQPNIIGPERQTPDVSNSTNRCMCDPSGFFPVCGSNDVNFHSPCYAGCTETERNGRMFVNCTAIPSGKASAGLCPFNCNTLYPFIAVNVIGSFIGSLSIMPTVIAKIRSVEDRDKGTGIGLQSTAVSLLGAIPIPIIIGKIIDTTCVIWETRGGSGACVLYNLADLRFRFLGTSLLYRTVTLVFTLIPLKLVWNIENWEDLWKRKSHGKEEESIKLVSNSSSSSGKHGDVIRVVT